MLYLLDENVLIDAQRDYYPIDRVPQFWELLVQKGFLGQVKVPQEVYERLTDHQDDPLAEWLKGNKGALLLDEALPSGLVARVVEQGYANDLTDDELEKMGNDPFLVAYALVAPNHRRVVTTEHSKPNRKRANRHIPDVCGGLGVRCIDTFELVRALDFRT